ncbi:MAG TPA: hypothetical protein VM260_16985, partial [Pirellula sp.]|nr:hypothetical protein [Pirellula sp.]
MKQFSVNFKIPLGSIFSSLVKDKDFIADCKALLAVDNDKIESLSAELDKQNLFADQKIIGSLAEKYLGDESPKIVHLMSRLCELIDDNGNGVAAGLDLVSEQLTARIDTSVMTEEEKTKLVRRLNLLLRANG